LKDLRHSCASLLLAKGIPMKAIQEWLGHFNFSTTANIYAHLDSKSKDLSVQALSNAISIKKMKKCSLQILKNQLALSN
jgi:site-specific recombinase XerD